MKRNKSKIFLYVIFELRHIKKIKKKFINFKNYFLLKNLRERLLKYIKYEYNLINLNEYKKVNQLIFGTNLFLFFLIKYLRLPFYKKFIFNIKLINLDLLILDKKIKFAYKYCQNLYKQYPKSKSEIDKRYFYILMRFNKDFKNEDNIIFNIPTGNDGLIFLTDSISTKNYLNLSYSQINEKKGRKILGAIISKKSFDLVEYLSKDYKTCNLHISKLLLLDSKILNIYINKFLRLKRLNYKLNLVIDNYSIFRKSNKIIKNKKIILNLISNCNTIYVSNQKIKELIEKEFKYSVIKVFINEENNYENLIGCHNKTRIRINNKFIDRNGNYTLHINHLSNNQSINFLKELSTKERGGVFKKNEKLIIFIFNESKKISSTELNDIIKVIKKNENIEVINKEYCDFWGGIYYLEYFKLAKSILILEENLDIVDFILLSKEINFKLYLNPNLKIDFEFLKHHPKFYINSFLEFQEKFKENIYVDDYKISKTINYFEPKLFENNILSEKTYTITRIIGNDLPPLHKKNQTLSNINFILKNEKKNSTFVRIWILNRVIDNLAAKKIKLLLSSHNEKFVEIKFDANEFKECNIRNIHHGKCLYNDAYHLDLFPKEIKYKLTNQFLKNYNRYLINNNGARNFALKIAKEYNLKWNFIFDGNIFIPKDNLKLILHDMYKSNTDFLILPMARIEEYKEIDSRTKLEYCEEPQIAFNIKNTQKFNTEYVYGSRSKVELFQKIQLIDSRNSLRTNIPNYLYEFDKVVNTSINYSYTAGIIRLPANSIGNKNDNAKIKLQKRSLNRDIAIYNFVRNILFKVNKTKNDSEKLLYSISKKDFLKNKVYFKNIKYISSNSIKSNLKLVKLNKINVNGIIFNETFKYLNELSIRYFFKRDESDIKEIIRIIENIFIYKSLKFNNEESNFNKLHSHNPKKNIIDLKNLYIFLAGLYPLLEDIKARNKNIYSMLKIWLLKKKKLLERLNYTISNSNAENTLSIWSQLEKISIDGFLNKKENLFKSYINTSVFLLNFIDSSGDQLSATNNLIDLDYYCLNLQLLININFIFINKLNINLFNDHQERNKFYKSIIYLYKIYKKKNSLKLNLDIKRLEIIFHLARSQSSIINKKILEENIQKIEILNSYNKPEKGIPLNWFLMITKK